jgi:hypothetical protein
MIRWCEDNPGKTARNLLQHMENQVGRDGENVEQGNTLPASAKAYDLRVLKILPGAKAMFRNHREISTLCVVLDHLAQGRVNQAADTVASRLKAVEQSTRDGNWDDSRYLELLPAMTEGLVTKDERQMVRHRVVEFPGPSLKNLPPKQQESRRRTPRLRFSPTSRFLRFGSVHLLVPV